jgi:hypothetical protein
MAKPNSTIDLSALLANLRDRGHGNCPHDDRADGPEEDCRACLSDCAVSAIQSIADANAALQGVAQQATALYKNAPPDWPMSAEQLTRARFLLETCDQQNGDWTGAAFTLIREIVDRMSGLQDVDSPEARLVRYQNALESIVGSIFTETDPKAAFVSLWGIAHDALSAPPTAAEVEAQPGSEVLCPRCAHVFCPSDDPLHFHHDGCPSCSPALADAIGERDFWKAQHDDKQTALEMAEHRLKVLEARPLQPSDVMAVQWKNDGDGGSLAAIKAIDDDDEIVFAADGTPALEIESPGRDVERVDVGDYVVRRVLGGLMSMKREVFEQTQKQIAEMGEPIGRLVYEDGSPISKPETER